MIVCPVYFWATLTPKAVAIETRNETITYATLNQHVKATEPRAHLVCDDPLQTVINLIAAFRSGYCVQLLDPQSRHTVPDIPEYWHTNKLMPNCWSITKPSTIIYTSGSSATPKGVIHNLEQHIWAALGAVQANQFLNTDAWLLNLPLHHVSGLSIFFRVLLRGARLVIPPKPNAFLMDLHRATHLSVVLPQLQRLIANKGNYSQLKYVLLGGSSCPEQIIAKARLCGIPLAVSYGLTEMCGQVSTSVGDDVNGRVLPYRSVYIDHNQIYVLGRCRCLGYWTPAGILLHTHAQAGLATRDQGMLQGNQIMVTGRLDAMFISGGENIQPEAIERVLLSHPSIQACCVVPKRCSVYGHRPVAFIEPMADDISDWANQRLHPYQRPVRYYPWPNNISHIKPNRAKLTQLV